ncbi:MAG: hypothetical protein EOM25_02895 [Deltaproteobacteria bacterium]|nr:hypothetical protein [Deltaproteobacteria bacterium]
MRSGYTASLVVYILQAGWFFFGIPMIIGAIINYVKLGDVRGTWLESHYRWQLRTFWFGLLWGVIGAVTWFLLIGYLILFINFIWMLYRVIRGWLRLMDGREMYA